VTTKDSDARGARRPPIFFKFEGNYGGDKYEDWLCSSISQVARIEKYSEKRLGGIRTIKSLARLLSRGYREPSRTVIRPFGLPLFRRNMIVVFHHFDHMGLPWYGRFIEWLDMAGLRLTAGLFGTKFLVVSRYWGEWLKQRNFDVEYLVYNQVPTNEAHQSPAERQRLAEKYGLDVDARWVFLGGNQWKKGGASVLEQWRAAGAGESTKFEFIFSGKADPNSVNADSKTIWIEDGDYYPFLRQLHAAVANSKFDEGWCRVVHEAILSEVPVAGSGRGGMRELLGLADATCSAAESDLVEFIKNPRPTTRDGKANVENTISQNNAREMNRLISDIKPI